jgi:hypothetical protein
MSWRQPRKVVSAKFKGQRGTREHTAETPPIRKSADYMPGKRFGRVKDKLGSILAKSFGDLVLGASPILI